MLTIGCAISTRGIKEEKGETEEKEGGRGEKEEGEKKKREKDTSAQSFGASFIKTLNVHIIQVLQITITL